MPLHEDLMSPRVACTCSQHERAVRGRVPRAGRAGSGRKQAVGSAYSPSSVIPHRLQFPRKLGACAGAHHSTTTHRTGGAGSTDVESRIPKSLEHAGLARRSLREARAMNDRREKASILNATRTGLARHRNGRRMPSRAGAQPGCFVLGCFSGDSAASVASARSSVWRRVT